MDLSPLGNLSVLISGLQGTLLPIVVGLFVVFTIDDIFGVRVFRSVLGGIFK